MYIIDFFFKCWNSLKVRSYHKIYLPYLKRQFLKCGEDVVIDSGSRIAGKNHIEIGDHVYVGPGAVFYSTVAYLHIGNYINISPNVSIMTGDHRIDVIGAYMSTVHEKLPENDKDVIIEDDVWIGTGAIILKGVTIGTGSVIAAGAIVTKDVKPYTIYIHVNKQYSRFSEEELERHLEKISGEKKL